MQTLSQKLITNTNDLYIHYIDKSIGTPPSLEQKNALPNLWHDDGNIIYVFKNCISISVATVLEVSKMTESICTNHWCLVVSFCLKVCIYSHTRGVKLGLALGFMQTSQVLPHWLNQSFSFWTLPYTQRHLGLHDYDKNHNCRLFH